MAFGRPAGTPAIDALFPIVFLLATLLNVLPAALAQPTREELIVIGAAHALFILRVGLARRAAAAQRAIDRERFQQMKNGRKADGR